MLFAHLVIESGCNGMGVVLRSRTPFKVFNPVVTLAPIFVVYEDFATVFVLYERKSN